MSTSSSSSLVVNGLISGINTTQVIQALLQGYSAPITQLQNQQSSLGSTASDYKVLNNDMQAVLTAAQALNTSSQWNLTKATSSDTDVATASSGAGAQTGTASFTVNHLAQGNVLVSKGGAASLSSSVTTATSLLVATGGAALGFSSLAAAGGLNVGDHKITVDQASTAASVAGTSAAAATTVIATGTNDTMNVTLGGTAYTLTLAAGSYSPDQLANAITSAAQAVHAPLTASANASGVLSLSSNEQGSDASISVDGGNALASVGFTSATSGVGSDAIVDVDGTKTTLTAINAGASISLGAPTGSITAQIAASANDAGSLIAAGTANAAVVSTGSGDLSDVVTGINNAGLNLTASAVRDSTGQYRLQVSADGTGLVGAASIDASSFSGGALASLSTITAAQDASISVGGADGYTLSSSTNSFSNLLAGTAITVSSQGSATVTVGQDPAGEASAVGTLVSAANQTLSDINSLTAFNATTKTGGPLMGSAIVDNLKNQIASIFAGVSGTSSLGNSANVGIKLNSDGTLTFDQTQFETAFASNAKQVTALFTQGATFAPSSSTYNGTVRILLGGDSTNSGSYDVNVSSSATQATDAGATLAGGAVSSGETLTIGDGASNASYTVNAGESLSAIASGLNGTFATNGLALTATVINNGTQLAITSDQYGSAQTFTVSSDAPGAGTTGLGGTTPGGQASFVGSDVAGTINGVAATGVGQVLSAPTEDATLNGLSVIVTAPGITSATDLGSLTYAPGIAQQLVSAAQQASNASTGSISTTIKGLTAESTGLTSQITQLQALEASQQSALQSEFTKMEVTLGGLKNESQSLTSAIANLPSV